MQVPKCFGPHNFETFTYFDKIFLPKYLFYKRFKVKCGLRF